MISIRVMSVSFARHRRSIILAFDAACDLATVVIRGHFAAPTECFLLLTHLVDDALGDALVLLSWLWRVLFSLVSARGRLRAFLLC